MADEINPPEKELLQLIASYPSLTDLAPSSWFVWSEDTGIPPKLRLASVCHADMRFHSAGYDHLVTAMPMRDEISIRYIRMLIHGPFRAFGDLITLKKHKHDYYIQVDHLDKWPANVLFNFCIASRVPIEYPYLFERWRELVKEGYPEFFSFLLSYSTAGKPFKKEREFPCHNHFWFDPAADWHKLLAGSPDLTVKSFRDAPWNTTPANVIWGKSDLHYKLARLTDSQVGEIFDIKLKPKPEPRKRLTPEAGLMKKYVYDIEAGQALHQAIHDEMVGAAPAVDPMPQPLAGAWAQIIANQQAGGVHLNAIPPVFPQQIDAAPVQPPQPPDWDIDEYDFPDFDDDD